MAENEEKKEDQFGFDAAGEALGYISLEQARLVAMQAARENPGNYGPRLAGTRMVFQLVEQQEGEDYYIVTLSFRPEGDFSGSPGQEQFFIEKESPVADRQVLNLPTGGRSRRFPVIPVVIGAGVLAVVVVAGVVFVAGGLPQSLLLCRHPPSRSLPRHRCCPPPQSFPSPLQGLCPPSH